MEIVYKIAIEMAVLCFLGALYYLYQKRKINSYVGIEKEKLILILIQLSEKKAEELSKVEHHNLEALQLIEKFIADLKSILEKKTQYLNHQDFVPMKKFLDENDPIIELLNEGYTHLFYEKKD